MSKKLINNENINSYRVDFERGRILIVYHIKRIVFQIFLLSNLILKSKQYNFKPLNTLNRTLNFYISF